MILKDLFFELHKYESEITKSDLAYRRFFRDLRDILGNNEHTYMNNHGFVSQRQYIVSENAILCIMRNDLNQAVNETLDFLQNYRDYNHEITYEEYTVLNCILCCYEGRTNVL